MNRQTRGMLAIATLWLVYAALVGAQSSQGVVNINTATAEQLELLPGVGPARAAAIVAHRKQHGPFERAEDLVAVSGIGNKALARMKSHVVTRGKTTAHLEGS